MQPYMIRCGKNALLRRQKMVECLLCTLHGILKELTCCAMNTSLLKSNIARSLSEKQGVTRCQEW